MPVDILNFHQFQLQLVLSNCILKYKTSFEKAVFLVLLLFVSFIVF